jgi:signal transduction histidine kinase
VLQEALNNVAKHSGADRAIIRLRLHPGTLELEIEDHGRGFGGTGRGLGLVAMRERAELVHGVIEFVTPTGGGTLVRLKVPLTAGAATPAHA